MMQVQRNIKLCYPAVESLPTNLFSLRVRHQVTERV